MFMRQGISAALLATLIAAAPLQPIQAQSGEASEVQARILALPCSALAPANVRAQPWGTGSRMPYGIPLSEWTLADFEAFKERFDACAMAAGTHPGQVQSIHIFLGIHRRGAEAQARQEAERVRRAEVEAYAARRREEAEAERARGAEEQAARYRAQVEAQVRREEVQREAARRQTEAGQQVMREATERRLAAERAAAADRLRQAEVEQGLALRRAEAEEERARDAAAEAEAARRIAEIDARARRAEAERQAMAARAEAELRAARTEEERRAAVERAAAEEERARLAETEARLAREHAEAEERIRRAEAAQRMAHQRAEADARRAEQAAAGEGMPNAEARQEPRPDTSGAPGTPAGARPLARPIPPAANAAVAACRQPGVLATLMDLYRQEDPAAGMLRARLRPETVGGRMRPDGILSCAVELTGDSPYAWGAGGGAAAQEAARQSERLVSGLGQVFQPQTVTLRYLIEDMGSQLQVTLLPEDDDPRR